MCTARRPTTSRPPRRGCPTRPSTGWSLSARRQRRRPRSPCPRGCRSSCRTPGSWATIPPSAPTRRVAPGSPSSTSSSSGTAPCTTWPVPPTPDRRLSAPTPGAVHSRRRAGLCRALHEAGVRIPDDVSVVGFDGIPLAEYLWPPLTTVAQDFPGIGRRLVELLLEQIRTGVELTDVHTLVPVELIVRRSTAAPNAARMAG